LPFLILTTLTTGLSTEANAAVVFNADIEEHAAHADSGSSDCNSLQKITPIHSFHGSLPLTIHEDKNAVTEDTLPVMPAE